MTIYAIQASDEQEYVDAVYESLRGGEGRFGWSGHENADLRSLENRRKKYGWDSLTQEEIEWYHHIFLLRLKDGDHVVYINVPKWGQCTLAKVTGPYYWRYDGGDFNHRFPVDKESVREFGRNDAIVPPALSARLKLQRRWWTIYTESEFKKLLEDLFQDTKPEPRTTETNRRYLAKESQPLLTAITEKIHNTHPNIALEFLLEDVFRKVPGVKEVKRQGGPTDYGADLLVYFEYGSIPGLVQTLVVQVKSYEGEHADTSAIQDIERAFKHYEFANMGLIVSTATCASEEFEHELDKLREREKKPVAFLHGGDLAVFFLRFGGDLLPKSAAQFS